MFWNHGRFFCVLGIPQKPFLFSYVREEEREGEESREGRKTSGGYGSGGRRRGGVVVCDEVFSLILKKYFNKILNSKNIPNT